VHPGDTIVLPATSGGWSVLGHVPDAPLDPAASSSHIDQMDLSGIDRGEQAYHQARGVAILRLRTSRMKDWPDTDAVLKLREWVGSPDEGFRKSEVRQLLASAADALQCVSSEIAASLLSLASRPRGLQYERYPGGDGVVLRNRRRLLSDPSAAAHLPAMDDGDDSPCLRMRKAPISLQDHTTNVRNELDRIINRLPLASYADVLRLGADLHDWGKVDERFQALLVDGDRDDVWAQRTLWAKSAVFPMSPAHRRAARRRSGLPDNFRHEMLSLQLAQSVVQRLVDDPQRRDLVLHVIAAHHGYGRPYAPISVDVDPPAVSLTRIGVDEAISAEERKQHPPHRLDSGVSERFWKLNDRFGWWGLVYLETVLRSCDQRASQREDEEDQTPEVERGVEV
jgi:CRISPR-associated endonuclease/helicase Cas3